MKMTLEALAQKLEGYQKFIELKLQGIEQRQEDIHTQVKITNGNVASNTKEIAKTNLVVWGVVCAGGGATTTIGIVWTIFTFFVK